MDDVIAIAEGGSAHQRKRILEVALNDLPDLAERDPQDLFDHLVASGVWRWFGDLPLYKTVGDPCVVFCVLRDDGDGPPQAMRIYALAAAPQPSALEGSAWQARLQDRCRSLGLID